MICKTIEISDFFFLSHKKHNSDYLVSMLTEDRRQDVNESTAFYVWLRRGKWVDANSLHSRDKPGVK